jgi:hypothetical protein
LNENVDVKTAAELMRHSPELFLRRYVKSDRARKLEAMKKMNAARIVRQEQSGAPSPPTV